VTFDLTTLRGTTAYTTSSPKFGTHCYTVGGALTNSSVDLPLSSSGANDTTKLGTGTIEGWIKSTSTDTRVAMGRAGWYWIGLVSGKLQGHYGGASVEVTLTSSTNFNDGSWHHVALVLTAGAGTLYADGNRIATSATTPIKDVSSGGFVVGGFGPAGADSEFDWQHQVDEVRVSTTARYSGSTYTTPTAAFTIDANTRAIYHLDNSGAGVGVSGVLIAPNDTGILYSSYTWKVGSTVSETINSGAYFRTIVTGTPTSIGLAFDISADTAPVPQVKWRVDQGGWSSGAVTEMVDLPIPSGTAWTSHSVEVVVKSTTETVSRWSTRSASVKLLGISSSSGASLVAPQARALSVLCYGDSITEGVRTLNSTATNDTDRNDATVGWAYRLTENLGAEVAVVGFGGTGLTVSGSGSVPALPSSYNLLWSGESRSFTTSPDVIVINIGENDGATDVTTTMTSFLNSLLSATAVTTKIIVLRPFSGAHASQLSAAVAACNSQARVPYVDTTGWWSTADSSDSLHPYGYANVATLSPKVANAIRTALQRGNLYLNVSGTATPVSVTI